MTTRPWMPLYVADYRADTAHLSAAQHGAYLLLIMHYWQTGKLPLDDSALARIACMSLAEWRRAKPVVSAFFTADWHHKRIDAELSKAADISNKRRASVGRRYNKSDTKAPTKVSSIEPTNVDQLNTHARATSQSQSQNIPEAEASGAPAPAEPRDVRRELFNEGRQTLERITGRTPDSCRRLLGKWLKSVNEDAIAVKGAIEDAERNRIVDPVPWIERSLHPKTREGQRHNVIAAADQLVDHMRQWEKPDEPDMLENLRSGTGSADVRLLPAHRSG